MDELGQNDLGVLFAEEPGAVIQVPAELEEQVLNILSGHGLSNCSFVIGTMRDDDRIVFTREGQDVINETRTHFRTAWAETTYHMQSLRDNPACAKSEYDAKFDEKRSGLVCRYLTFDTKEDIAAPYIVGINCS